MRYDKTKKILELARALASRAERSEISYCAASSAAKSRAGGNAESLGLDAGGWLESGVGLVPLVSGWISCVRGIIALHE